MPPKSSKKVVKAPVVPSIRVVTSQGDCASLDSTITHVQDLIPLCSELVPPKERVPNMTLAPTIRPVSWTPLEKGLGRLQGTLPDGTVVERMAYRKLMPLLTPYRWMRYHERPSEPFYWNFQTGDLLAPTNQGYVDAVTSHLVSQLALPHVCSFFAAQRGRVETFLYNLEDDFDEFRFTRWFWAELDKGSFGLRVYDKSAKRCLTMEEIKAMFKPDDEYLSDEETHKTVEEEELAPLSAPLGNGCEGELVEISDIESLASGDSLHLKRRGGGRISVTESDAESEDEDDDSEDDMSEFYEIHTELYGMPVAILYQEALSGTLDDLLVQEETFLKTSIPLERTKMWAAWLFQICITLAHFQGTLRLTHNDLHTNNVLWAPTDQEFFWYTDGTHCWKVPTYGKRMVIIDYGRAIFTLHGYTMISSDYEEGHDAADMYNFGRIEDLDLPKCLPNKSFDLCRLATSLLRGLYPTNPPAKPKGRVMSSDGGVAVHETKDELFNTLWSWMVDKNKESVLEDEEGEEKHPGFSLYMVIASSVTNAVPEKQLGRPLFASFVQPSLPAGVPVIRVSP